MKKSLVVTVVLVTSLALSGTVFANMDWSCLEMPVCKPICRDQVLCMGQAKGMIPLCAPCGPCPPVISYSGKWLTVAKCPPPAKVEKAEPQPPFITLPKVTKEGCCLFVKAEAAKAPKAAKAAKKAKEKK